LRNNKKNWEKRNTKNWVIECSFSYNIIVVELWTNYIRLCDDSHLNWFSKLQHYSLNNKIHDNHRAFSENWVNDRVHHLKWVYFWEDEGIKQQFKLKIEIHTDHIRFLAGLDADEVPWNVHAMKRTRLLA
jgi:hypothetical protein